MRVLMTTDTLGGVWMYSLDLTEGLLKDGCDVCLVSLGRYPDESQSKDIARLRELSPRRFEFRAMAWPLEWMPGETQIEESTRELMSLVSAWQPDLLHSNQFCYGALPSRVPRMVVAHSDVISWWHARFGEEPEDTGWIHGYRDIVSKGLQAADLVVAPSEAQLRSLEDHFGVLEARGRVIYNSSPVVSRSSHNRKLRAITAGRLWDEGKNTGVVPLARLPLPVLVAGQQHERSNAKQTSDVDGVTMLGQLDRAALSEAMLESAMYLGTSLYEPFGLAPLEAAHAGCALVLSDIPSFHEIWGDAAVYFDPRDPASLHDAVVQLIEWPQLLAHLQHAAQTRARERYGVDRSTADYRELYNELAGKRSFAHVA